MVELVYACCRSLRECCSPSHTNNRGGPFVHYVYGRCNRRNQRSTACSHEAASMVKSRLVLYADLKALWLIWSLGDVWSVPAQDAAEVFGMLETFANHTVWLEVAVATAFANMDPSRIDDSIPAGASMWTWEGDRLNYRMLETLWCLHRGLTCLCLY